MAGEYYEHEGDARTHKYEGKERKQSFKKQMLIIGHQFRQAHNFIARLAIIPGYEEITIIA